jgi:hypothetical protein
MSRQFWNETLAWATNDGVAVANTVTETIIFPNVTVPANYLQDGRTLRLRAIGKHSTTGTPTLTFRLRWGGVTGTVIAVTGAITTGSAVANALFDIDLLMTVRSNGSTGTVMCNGSARVHSSAGTPAVGSATNQPAEVGMTAGGQAVPAAVTLDLTVDTALAITATWSAASASNTLQGVNYVIEAMN